MEEQPNVTIEVSTKLVEEGHFEVTTAYASHADDVDESPALPHIQVLRGTSSAIAPGLSVRAS